MTTRILPRDEYGRLAGTELETVAHALPVGTHVVVVEDGDRIVGCWSLMPVWHAEGLWTAPDRRKDPRIGRRLLRGLFEIARVVGAKTLITSALTDEIASFATRIGGGELPGRHFAVPVHCVDARNTGE